MKYIRRLGGEDIWNHGEIDLWDFSAANTNVDSKIEAAAMVAGTGDLSQWSLPLVHEFVRGASDLGLDGSWRNNDGMPTFETIAYPGHISVEALRSMNFNGLATFRIKAPLFLISQIVQYKQFAYYELPQEIDLNDNRPLDYWDLWENWSICVGRPIPILMKDTVEDMYRCLVYEGESPENARSILPLATYSTIWMQGDVAAFKDYFEILLDSQTQEEHRELAKTMLDLLKEHQARFYERVTPEVNDE